MKKQPNPSTESASIPSSEENSKEGVTFESLGLSPRLLLTVAGLGFEQPTPIQVSAIPPLLEGRDLVGQARTGTGKTAAFGLPLVSRLTQGRGRGLARGLVLTPTRELALQVTEALRQFAGGGSLRLLTVYGGSPYGPQLRGLREGVDIVVGTPGRVIDLIDRGDLKLGEVEMVVLDEADEMLEMGFIEAVETILARTPEASRQVALFSATMPTAIRKVAERYLKDPVNIKEASQTVIAIEQCYVQVPPRFKREALLRILRSEDRGATLVFASTRASCAEAADALAVAGIPAEPLHGDLSQPARERVIELLRARRVEVVVATDIAARGIDIEHLTHIINLDLPKNVEIYTHRIGRTGRAGRSGKAITLVVPRESMRFTEGLRRRGVQLEEMFIASEHELATRQREGVVSEMAALADGQHEAKLEDARRWAADLIAAGTSAEDLAVQALALLGDAKNLRLGQTLDKGLPPWARQPANARFEQTAPGPRAVRKPAHAQADEPRSDTRSKRPAPVAVDPLVGPEPTGEAFVVVGIGRNHAVRPADLVGALTNELGLTGRDIGRVEIRDTTSVIGVPAAFAARVGDDAWPVTIRRVDTTVQRHSATVASHAARKPFAVTKKPFERGPAKPRWSPHDPPVTSEPAEREVRPRSARTAPSEPAAQASAPAAPRAARAPRAAEPIEPAPPAPRIEPEANQPPRRRPPARDGNEPRPIAEARSEARTPYTAEPRRAPRSADDTRRPAPTHARAGDPRRPTADGRGPRATADSRAPSDVRRPPAAADARRPTKRPAAKSAGDHPPRRAVDVSPRTPRTPRDS